jgi:hypothetical protein
MGNMMDLGQAAGVAAALSAKGGVYPRQLDVKDIQHALLGMGVKIYRGKEAEDEPAKTPAP